MSGIKEVYFTDMNGKRILTFMEEMELKGEENLKVLKEAFESNRAFVYVKCWSCFNWKEINQDIYCKNCKNG